MQFFPGISFADTITNSSHAMPGPKVILRIRPRGMWLRTVAPKSIFGRTIAATYCDLPVTLWRPSLRGTDLPTRRSVLIADGIVYDRLGANAWKADRKTLWDRSLGRVRGVFLTCRSARRFSFRKYRIS